MKLLFITFMVVTANSFAVTPTPTATPAPAPIKGFIDPCKLETQGPSHSAWKAVHC